MAATEDLIIQSNREQLSRISDLTEISNEDTQILNNSYLLLAYPAPGNGEPGRNYKQTVQSLLEYFSQHIKDDIISDLKNADTIEEINNILAAYGEQLEELGLSDLITRTQLKNTYLAPIHRTIENYQNIIKNIQDHLSESETTQNNINQELTNNIQDISNTISQLSQVNEEQNTRLLNLEETYVSKNDLRDSYNILQQEINNYNNSITELKNDVLAHDIESEEALSELSNNVTLLSNSLDIIQQQVSDNTQKINEFDSTEYISKTELDRKLLQITSTFNNYVNEMFNSIQALFGESAESSEYMSNELTKIKNELMTNENGLLGDSRIDKLEEDVLDIRHSGISPVDVIDKVVWTGYSIPTVKDRYISGEQFVINKGTVTVYYNDGSAPENVTNKAVFNISGGTLNNYIVTAGNTTTTGKITVTYNNHTAVNEDNTSARLTFNVVKPEYYNYLWFTDGSNINKIIENNQFTDNCIDFIANSKLIGQCPMVQNTQYNVFNILNNKFENIDIDSGLYMIIPSQYITIDNNNIIINSKPVTVGNFPINIDGVIEPNIVLETKSTNVPTQLIKNIEYMIIYISSETINSAIVLNY